MLWYGNVNASPNNLVVKHGNIGREMSATYLCIGCIPLKTCWDCAYSGTPYYTWIDKVIILHMFTEKHTQCYSYTKTCSANTKNYIYRNKGGLWVLTYFYTKVYIPTQWGQSWGFPIKVIHFFNVLVMIVDFFL